MKTFPLQSPTFTQAQQKQFALVDTICCHFPGADSLIGGDLGLAPGLNQPRMTQRAKKVLAEIFHAEATTLVRRTSAGAIHAGLVALLRPGQRLLVHDAPVYPTTQVLVEQMGIALVRANFSCLPAVTQTIAQHRPDAALMRHTRQQPQDRYVLTEVLAEITKCGVPTLTDDNYAVIKVDGISYECGATLSTFSCFKLSGPEGVEAVVGKTETITKVHVTLYSGDSQIRGAQALGALRGLVLAPVMHAIQTGTSEWSLAALDSGMLPEVKKAIIANAQSKVLIVELRRPIAARMPKAVRERGALPCPAGAESKHETLPLFYRLSGTFCETGPLLGDYVIRINPSRGGKETVLRILRESVSMITYE